MGQIDGKADWMRAQCAIKRYVRETEKITQRIKRAGNEESDARNLCL